MATELKAVRHDITILFDPAALATDPFSYQIDGGPVEEDFRIEVRSNLAVFDFFLRTQTSTPQGSLASFATSPLQWLSASLTPTPMPGAFFFQRDNDLSMTLINLNSVEIPDEKFSFNFEIGVVYQGRTYTSADPTIINVQPPPPAPDESEPWPDSRPSQPVSVLAS
jgi:hypothetical protein